MYSGSGGPAPRSGQVLMATASRQAWHLSRADPIDKRQLLGSKCAIGSGLCLVECAPWGGGGGWGCLLPFS